MVGGEFLIEGVCQHSQLSSRKLLKIGQSQSLPSFSLQASTQSYFLGGLLGGWWEGASRVWLFGSWCFFGLSFSPAAFGAARFS